MYASTDPKKPFANAIASPSHRNPVGDFSRRFLAKIHVITAVRMLQQTKGKST
jgi:hypothetical protein